MDEKAWPWVGDGHGLEWVTELKDEKVELRDSKTGQVKMVSMSKHMVWTRNGHLAAKCVVIDDITRDVRYAEKISFLATSDQLTQLLNRQSFMDGASSLIKGCSPAGAISLMIIGIDGFKAINELHSFSGGDEVLRDVAWMIRRNVHDGDLLGRIGTDEFALIIGGMEKENAELLGERIRRRIQGMDIHYGKSVIRVTASIGVYTCMAAEWLTADKLIGGGESALQLARSAGGNSVSSR
jgi:diguanylate cyclase (GGDEF)-like protein